jgi:ADP-ribose pyrophosphatase
MVGIRQRLPNIAADGRLQPTVCIEVDRGHSISWATSMRRFVRCISNWQVTGLENGSFRKLTDLKWLNIFEVFFRDKQGRRRSWMVTTRRQTPKCATGRFEKPDAVVIAAFHRHHNKLVVNREHRVALGGDEYGFPAGLVDAGETVEDAVRRELKEETGLVVTRFLKVGPPVYSSAGMTDESVSMVFVECEGEVTTAGNEGVEQIEPMLLSREEVTRLSRDPSKKFDAKAWLVMLDLTGQNPLADFF